VHLAELALSRKEEKVKIKPRKHAKRNFITTISTDTRTTGPEYLKDITCKNLSQKGWNHGIQVEYV
jgi:hypothetical protein